MCTTKRLFAIGMSSLAIGALLLWMSLNIYQESVAERVENERCMNAWGLCRVVFPDQLEHDSIITAIFGGGLAAFGVITYNNQKNNDVKKWKLPLAAFFAFLGGYTAYFWLFSILKEYGPLPFYFL